MGRLGQDGRAFGPVILMVTTLMSAAARGVDLERLSLPPGFALAVYSDHVPNARQMVLAPSGALFVGSRSAGAVYAVRDTDGDKVGDRVYQIAEGLEMPTGVAFRDGALYVGALDRILRFDDIERRLENPPEPVVVYDNLPDKTHHGWKYLDFGPDGKLYVPVGAPCNVCLAPEPFATILRMNPDGSGVEVVARGVRNSVGFAWHPATHEFWFTDNGRDWLGDDVPPCELNRVTEAGQHFGFPFVHGGDIRDPEFGADKDPDDYVPPAMKLGPHVAPLGFVFYTGEQFPAAYRSSILLAEHGSWNRSTPVGYRIMKLTLNGSEVTSYEPFIAGWLARGQVSGRPVDLEPMPDGSVLISDDEAGVIYRLTYSPP